MVNQYMCKEVLILILTASTQDSVNWGATGYEKISDNVANILKTRKYEIPYMREFGISPDFIDSPLEEMKGLLTSNIIELVEEYEPRVKVKDVEFINSDNTGNVDIKVVFEI